RGEEIGLLRTEAKRRDEEMALLRRQVDAQQEERQSREQARLSIFAGVQGSGSERGIEYTVGLQNIGESVASQIAVEMVNGLGEPVGMSALVPTLVPGEKAYASVMTPPRDRFSGPYEIFFEWDD